MHDANHFFSPENGQKVIHDPNLTRVIYPFTIARAKSKSPLVTVAATADAVPKRNLIPTGRQIVRTPQVELAKQPKVRAVIIPLPDSDPDSELRYFCDIH